MGAGKALGGRVCKGIFILFIAAPIFGLCGCQQDKGTEKKEAVATDSPDRIWEEQWTVALENGKEIPIQMNCELNLLQKQVDCIVHAHPFDIDSQNKERMAKGVFGDEVYLYDVEHMCQKDLKERLHREKTILEKTLPELENRQGKEREKGTAYRRKMKKELKDRIKLAKKCLKTAPEKPVPVQDGAYTGDSYRGNIGGVAFRLEFNRKDRSCYDFYDNAEIPDSPENARTIELLPVDDGDFAPEGLAGAQNISSRPYEGDGNASINQCTLSEEEAQKKAEDMLQKLQAGQMARVGMQPLSWRDIDGRDSTEELINGYVFYFQTAVDGNILQTLENPVEELDYGRESVQVQVTDKGVVRVMMDAPIQVDRVTPGVKVLGFQDIKEMLRTQMAFYIQEWRDQIFEKNMELYEIYKKEGRLTDKNQGQEEFARERDVFLESGFNGTSLQRIYCRINDPLQRLHYNFLPVYELTGVDGEGQVHRLFVNAVDGSFIAFSGQ